MVFGDLDGNIAISAEQCLFQRGNSKLNVQILVTALKELSY